MGEKGRKSKANEKAIKGQTIREVTLNFIGQTKGTEECKDKKETQVGSIRFLCQPIFPAIPASLRLFGQASSGSSF